MNLVYNLLTEQFQLNSDNLTVLCIENKEEFRRVLSGLDEDYISFYQDLEKVPKKYIFTMNSLVDFDINTKKNIDSLYKDMENYFRFHSGDEAYSNFIQSLFTFSDSLVDNEKYDLIYNEDFQFTNFLKFMGFRFRVDSENYLTSLLDYIDVVSDIFHIKVFIIPNLLVFLTQDEVKEVISLTEKLSIHLISIESIYKEEYYSYNKLVFDQDLCRIC